MGSRFKTDYIRSLYQVKHDCPVALMNHPLLKAFILQDKEVVGKLALDMLRTQNTALLK